LRRELPVISSWEIPVFDVYPDPDESSHDSLDFIANALAKIQLKTCQDHTLAKLLNNLREVASIDDIPRIHYGIGYFFSVVVAVRLRPRVLVCWWLATPGAMIACDFLNLLVSLVLLLQLTMMASLGMACLRYYCCSRLRSGAMK